MTPATQTSRQVARRRGARLPVSIFVAVTAGLVMTQSWMSLLMWALDGVVAAAVIVGSTLAGYGLLPLFRLGPMPQRFRWLLAAGLGIGALSLLVLGCGVVGLIGADRRLVAPGILLVGAINGLRVSARARENNVPRSDTAGRMCWITLAAAPFAALAMLVASLPPGVLWREEGFGYDVLEYHLQLPREYYENGIIGFLPHNVYANLPAAAEMLYLFGNLVTGETIDAWPVAECINALLAGLTVAAAWLVARELSPAVGVATIVVAASTGWLVYLSGVAYVENGLLFLGMLAVACIIRGTTAEPATSRHRWTVVAGVMCGLACGFKYTAVGMIALPAAVFQFVLSASKTRRLRSAGLFAAAVLLTFSPWLIKNAAMTGNPVFPLASRYFTTQPSGWGHQQALHFAACHAPAPEESGWRGRTSLVWRHIITDPSQRFGPLIFILAAVALVRRRGRLELAAAAMLASQMVVWMFATHLYARFAIPIIVPLVLLAARGAAGRRQAVAWPTAVLIVAGAGFNLTKACGLYAEHVYPNGQRVNLEGATQLFTDGLADPYAHLAAVNRDLPDDAYVLLVGDARPFYFERKVDYCVVFNRSPFAAAADESPSVVELIEWLGRRGYTHVLVHWAEIHRLRSSRYGFPEAVNPALFQRMRDAGLRLVEEFRYRDTETAYAELYEVPR